MRIESVIAGPAPDSAAREAAIQVAIRWRWPLWVALTALMYCPLFQTRPVFDDVAHVEFAARHGWDVLHMGPLFFRPFERTLIGINWMLSGNNFWLLRTVALAVLIVKASLVYNASRRLVNHATSWIPWVASLVYLAHPMNVSAVGKIDTSSEDLVALFALLVFNLALASVRGRDGSLPPALLRNALLAAATVFLGMLSKEAFAGFAAATPVLFALATGTKAPAARRALATLVAALAIAAAAYIWLRLTSGFPLTGALEKAPRYELHLGANVVMNIAAELGSIAFPGNTLAIFVALNPVHIAISMALLVAVSTLAFRRANVIAIAVRTDERERRLVAMLLVAILASFFPSCMITELVSENQTAEALPFVIIACMGLFGLGSQTAPRSLPAYRILSVVAVIWLAAATGDKAAAARNVSVRAYEIGDRIAAAYYAKPKPTMTVCFAPGSVSAHPRKYSVLSMPDEFAAYFQLYRLRLAQPAPVVNVVDLTAPGSAGHPPCDISINPFTIVRE